MAKRKRKPSNRGPRNDYPRILDRPDYNIVIAAIAGALVAKEIDWSVTPFFYNTCLESWSLPASLCYILAGLWLIFLAMVTFVVAAMFFGSLDSFVQECSQLKDSIWHKFPKE